MKVLLILVALVGAVSASKFAELVLKEWETHKLTHNLKFPTVHEDQYRLGIYIDNRIEIARHNAEFARGKVGFTREENRFTHMTAEEAVDIMNGFNRAGRKGGKVAPTPSAVSTFVPPEGDVPAEIDWRTKGAVTPVKDQGLCGSCYAFSAVGSLEGQHFLKKNKLVSLSEQNLVDCSTEEGNQGCDGGYMSQCFMYVEDNKGIDTETGYPYMAVEKKCAYKVKDKGATDYGYVNITRGDEEALKKAVATVGPISVAIDASLSSFFEYRQGVYDDPACKSSIEDLDHGVTLVGYGTEDGKDFWLVKNSWGSSWGENGYIKMARNKNNLCGIATLASYPIVH